MEIGSMAYQDGFDVVGMRELADGNAQEAVEDDVAIVAGALAAKTGPVMGQFRRTPDQEVTLGTRGERGCERRNHRERWYVGRRKNARAQDYEMSPLAHKHSGMTSTVKAT